MKTCKCGGTDFAKDATAKDGLQSSCRKCQATRSKARRGRYKAAADFDIDVVEPDEVLSDAEILVAQMAPEAERQATALFHRSLIFGETPPPVNTFIRKDSYGAPPLKRIAIIPDVHAPYHDKRAWRLMLQVLRSWKPNVIVDEGDFVDCYSVSSHDKRPDRVRVLDEEIASANELLTELDALGATEKYFVAGNHEDRLERYLTQKAPELFNMVKMRDLLKLDERGWKYIPYKQSLKLGKLNVTHDCGNAGPQAHAKALTTFQHNIAIGHTHRMAVAYEGNAAGESHVGAMFGWLGDVTAIDYMHRVAALRAWQLGFGVGWMEESGVVHLSPVPIVNYRCVLEGRLYVG